MFQSFPRQGRRVPPLALLLVLLLPALPLSAAPRKAGKALQAKPVIGINMDVRGEGESTGPVSLRITSAYVDAVTSAGGIAVVLPPVLERDAMRRHVALCDGFVFIGGGDINPERYGETSHSSVRLLHPRREEYDLTLYELVLKSRKPVLGVCLGCQELNVALGGTLVQDIPSETSTTISHRQGGGRGDFAHAIEVIPGSKLEDVLGTTTVQVNSFHHQAVDTPGKGLRVAARAPDGVVEAIELPGKRFALGVQWHPEGLTHHSEHLRVYEALVKAAARHRQGEGVRKNRARGRQR